MAASCAIRTSGGAAILRDASRTGRERGMMGGRGREEGDWKGRKKGKCIFLGLNVEINRR